MSTNDVPQGHEQEHNLDVRELPPAQRHATIFRQFAELPTGDAFILVNDHDPKPLYYQLNFEHKGEFEWDYLEQGPVVWRVRISRTAPAKTQGKRSLPVRSAGDDTK